MRNSHIVLIMSLLVFSTVSCSKSENEQMKDSIKDFMDEQSGKKEYQALSYGEVDSVFEVMEETSKFKKLDDELIKLEADSSGAAIMMRLSGTPEEEVKFKKNVEKVNNLIAEKRQEFKDFKEKFSPKHVGYELQHTYKIGKEERTMNFLLDTTYTVLKRYPLVEQEEETE